MIISCDVDGILNDLAIKTITLYNHRNNTNIKFSDITTYNFYDCFPEEVAKGLIALFKEKELWDSLEPLPHSQKGLRQLMERGHQIYLATATNSINFHWKCDWLKKYYPFLSTDRVIRIMNKSLLKSDVIIDDCLDNLLETSALRICLDQPWNRDIFCDLTYDIKRAFDWNDIIEIIKFLEKRR